jgi:hypothetical protein
MQYSCFASAFVPCKNSFLCSTFLLVTYLVKLPTTGLLARNNFRLCRHPGTVDKLTRDPHIRSTDLSSAGIAASPKRS